MSSFSECPCFFHANIICFWKGLINIRMYKLVTEQEVPWRALLQYRLFHFTFLRESDLAFKCEKPSHNPWTHPWNHAVWQMTYEFSSLKLHLVLPQCDLRCPKRLGTNEDTLSLCCLPRDRPRLLQSIIQYPPLLPLSCCWGKATRVQALAFTTLHSLLSSPGSSGPTCSHCPPVTNTAPKEGVKLQEASPRQWWKAGQRRTLFASTEQQCSLSGSTGHRSQICVASTECPQCFTHVFVLPW